MFPSSAATVAAFTLAVPLMIDALGAPDRLDTAILQLDLASHGRSAVPALVAALARPEPAVRRGAATALGDMVPRPAEAAPALIRALTDPETEVRAAAAGGLRGMRPAADVAVPALAAAVRDAEPGVRAAAAAALGEFGRRAEPAAGAVAAALADSDVGVRRAAVEAVGRIGPAAKAGVPALIEAVNGGNDDLRQKAAVALGGIGPDAAAAVPSLLRLAKSEAAEDRQAGIRGLGGIGPAAEAGVPLLVEGLGRGEPSLEPFWAIDALGRIGSPARAAVPALTRVARDGAAGEWVRQTAAAAVRRIDPRFAAREGLTAAAVDLRRGEVPAVPFQPRPPTTEAQAKRIRDMIARLADPDRPAAGLVAAPDRLFDAPSNRRRVCGTAGCGVNPHIPAALRDLVAEGPAALPFLAAALGDRTPTRFDALALPIATSEILGPTDANPFNPKDAVFDNPPGWLHDAEFTDSYRATIGDLCLAALGQIVGRQYRDVDAGQWGVIRFGEAAGRLRDRLRAAWGGPDPARALLDSLLIDFSTEGVRNEPSHLGWFKGSDFQTEAAVRLLVYFPREATPLVAARLRSLDVRGDSSNGSLGREVRNRILTTEFIKAAAWCQAPEVRAALADISRRTDDPEIKKLLSTPAP